MIGSSPHPLTPSPLRGEGVGGGEITSPLHSPSPLRGEGVAGPYPLYWTIKSVTFAPFLCEGGKLVRTRFTGQ